MCYSKMRSWGKESSHYGDTQLFQIANCCRQSLTDLHYPWARTPCLWPAASWGKTCTLEHWVKSGVESPACSDLMQPVFIHSDNWGSDRINKPSFQRASEASLININIACKVLEHNKLFKDCMNNCMEQQQDVREQNCCTSKDELEAEGDLGTDCALTHSMWTQWQQGLLTSHTRQTKQVQSLTRSQVRNKRKVGCKGCPGSISVHRWHSSGKHWRPRAQLKQTCGLSRGRWWLEAQGLGQLRPFSGIRALTETS